MVEQRVEREFQAVLRRRARRDCQVEEGLRAGFVKLRIGLHRPDDAIRIRSATAAETCVRGVLRSPAPTGEHACQARDVGVAIGLDRLSVDQFRRAIEVDLGEADREELHDLAREVLVGHAAGHWIGLLVAQVRQVNAHHRAGRDAFEQRAVVAERMLAEQVDIVRETVGGGSDRPTFGRYDDDLRQRELHSLAQLVRRGDRLLPERVLHEDEIAAEQQRVVVRLYVGQMRNLRKRELLVDPAGIAECLHAGDVRVSRTEARLHQEACRVVCGW